MSYLPYNFIQQAIDEIYYTYGHRVRVGRKTLRKYGVNSDVDTSEVEINPLDQNENYLSANLITHAVSSSTSDTGSLYIEGMILVGGNLYFRSQTITMTGQTKAALTTPLARVTRARYLGATVNVGDVYVMEDEAVSTGVPVDLAHAHLKMLAGEAASLKAATSIASTNYFVMTYWRATVAKKTTSAVVDVRLKARSIGNAFITQDLKTASVNAPAVINEPPYRIFQPNTDILMTATSSVNDTEVASSFGGFFADILTDEEYLRSEQA